MPATKHSSVVSTKIKKGLDKIDPGQYSVSDLQRILCASGDATWSTSWGTVHSCLQKHHGWHWNGLTAPTKNKWIKDPPKPMPVPHTHEIPASAPPPKGMVTLRLERVELMLETLLKEMQVPLPPKV
jgi:hypothetical protein